MKRYHCRYHQAHVTGRAARRQGRSLPPDCVATHLSSRWQSLGTLRCASAQLREQQPSMMGICGGGGVVVAYSAGGNGKVAGTSASQSGHAHASQLVNHKHRTESATMPHLCCTCCAYPVHLQPAQARHTVTIKEVWLIDVKQHCTELPSLGHTPPHPTHPTCSTQRPGTGPGRSGWSHRVYQSPASAEQTGGMHLQ
jgi:hypothetical protein